MKKLLLFATLLLSLTNLFAQRDTILRLISPTFNFHTNVWETIKKSSHVDSTIHLNGVLNLSDSSVITIWKPMKDSTWWENKSDTIRNIGAVIIAKDSGLLKEIWPKYLVCKYKKKCHRFGEQHYYDFSTVKWNEHGNAIYPCNPPDINEENYYTDKGRRIIIDHYSSVDDCGNWSVKFVAISKRK